MLQMPSDFNHDLPEHRPSDQNSSRHIPARPVGTRATAGPAEIRLPPLLATAALLLATVFGVLLLTLSPAWLSERGQMLTAVVASVSLLAVPVLARRRVRVVGRPAAADVDSKPRRRLELPR